MDAISLFAGIGGFDCAAHSAGIRVSAAAEIEPQAASVFARNFPATYLFKDVRDVTKKNHHTEVDAVFGGWPCQGNSIAGQRAGMADSRSGLWIEVRRILKEFRPTWFVGENVPGLLSVNKGKDFGKVLNDLAELGYGFAYRVLDAQYFGVPQRRRRVFIVGCLRDWRSAAKVLFEPESLCGSASQIRKKKPSVAACLTAGVAAGSGISRPGRRREDDENLVANTLVSTGNLKHDPTRDNLISSTIPSSDGGVSSGMHPIVAVPDPSYAITGNGSKFGSGRDSQDTFVIRSGVRRLTPIECERLQGFPDNYTQLGKNDEVMSDSARYRMLGNAVAVPVVEWILKRLIAVSNPVSDAP